MQIDGRFLVVLMGSHVPLAALSPVDPEAYLHDYVVRIRASGFAMKIPGLIS